MVPTKERTMAKKEVVDDRRRLNISLTEEEKEALEAQAAKEYRTMSGLAKMYVLKGLAEAVKRGEK
jgi:hypothetical protein